MKTEAQIRFMKLYEPQHEAFVRFCAAKSYGVMETEDLVNETLAAVFQKLGNLKCDQAFLSYLFSTASNIIKNEIRRKKIIYYEADFTVLAEKSMIQAEDERADIAILYEALNHLPGDQKEALVLFEISGFRIKEIATLFHTSEDTIKQRLSRGRKQLAKLLNVQELDHEPAEHQSRILIHLFL